MSKELIELRSQNHILTTKLANLENSRDFLATINSSTQAIMFHEICASLLLTERVEESDVRLLNAKIVAFEKEIAILQSEIRKLQALKQNNCERT
jgi:hypothetical protein